MELQGEGLEGGLPVVSLTGHIAFSTAFQNDNTPALVFAQQVNAYGQAGDVLVIPCESIHKVIYDSKPHSRLLVNFDKSYIPPSLVPLLSDVIHLVRVSRIQKVLENLFQKIKGEYEHPDAFPRSVSSATLPSCSSRLPVHRTAR